jgi:hypothetical protein
MLTLIERLVGWKIVALKAVASRLNPQHVSALLVGASSEPPVRDFDVGLNMPIMVLDDLRSVEKKPSWTLPTKEKRDMASYFAPQQGTNHVNFDEDDFDLDDDPYMEEETQPSATSEQMAAAVVAALTGNVGHTPLPPSPLSTGSNVAPAIGQTAGTTEFKLEQDIASQVCGEFLNVHKQLEEQSRVKDEMIAQINLQNTAMSGFSDILQQHTNEFDVKIQDALTQQSKMFESRIHACMQKQSDDTETKFGVARKETENNFLQMMQAFSAKNGWGGHTSQFIKPTIW